MLAQKMIFQHKSAVDIYLNFSNDNIKPAKNDSTLRRNSMQELFTLYSR